MASIYKRGDAWYLNWHDAGGQHRKSLGEVTAREAERILRAKEHELLSGRGVVNIGSPMFGAFADNYLRWYQHEFPHSFSRAESIVRLHLLPDFEFTPLLQLTHGVVSQWKMDRSAKVKTETVNKELRTLKAMLNRAVEWQVIDRNPCATVKAKQTLDSKPPRFYSKDELQAIYQAAKGWRWVWQLMANTGLRRGEAQQLRREHVLPDRIRVLSSEGARTKSGKWRDVPLSDGAKEALERLPGSPYVLDRITPPSLSRAFIKDARRAQVGGNVHLLRHTFCSHLVMRGVPLRVVQTWAGHAHYKTTEKYSHLAPGHMADVMSGFSL